MGNSTSKTPEEMSKIQQLVDSLIAQNNVMLFTKAYCPYCRSAKSILSNHNIKFQDLDLENEKDGADIQNYLREKTGQSSVPNIFIKQKHIGGCDDLKKLESSGKLDSMV